MHLVVLVCGSGMEAFSHLLSTMRFSRNWALCGISHEAAGARGFPFSSPLFVSIAAVSMQEGDCVSTIHSSILLLFTKVLLTFILTAALACLFLLLRRRAFSCTILQNSVLGNFVIPHSLSLIAPLPPPSFPFPPFQPRGAFPARP